MLKCLFFNAILFSFLVTGCTNTAPRNDRQGSKHEDIGIDFRISGKLAIREGKTGHTVRFNWLQRDNQYDIEVWGPLGQGRTRLSGNQQYLKITRGAQLLESGVPREVMHRQLGWRVPVTLLPSWIVGEPLSSEDVSALQRDLMGRIVQFSQLGWEVKLEKFGTSDAAAKPRKITAVQGSRKVIVRIFDTL